MPAPITDLTTALLTGLTAGIITLVSAIPAILGALAILIIGWIISGAVAGLVVRALRALRIDMVAERAGVTNVLRRAQVNVQASKLVGEIVKWYLRLVFVLMAANALNLTVVSTIVNQVLAFIPNLFAAALILAAFAWLAGVAQKVVTGALEPTLPNARTLGVLAYAATFGFGVVAAATQIGIASSIIQILFVGIVGGLALAFGLAFGLGGRDEAAQIWRDMRASVDGVRTVSRTPGNGHTLAEREAALSRR